MAEFIYTGKDAHDKTISGTIDAEKREDAVAALLKRGVTVQTVKPAKATGMNMNISLPGGGRIKPKTLVVFTRQFATMVSAGVPMLRALTTLQEQAAQPAFKEVLGKVTADVQGGVSLSDAFAKHPKAFSNVYVNMIRAGEAGGILDQIMNRLANQVEKDSEIKAKFKGAMVYPIVVVLVAVGAVGFLMVGVVPKLAGILEDAGGELPMMTNVVLSISRFMTGQWYILIAGIVALAFLFKRFTSSPKGKFAWHKFLLRIPIFGDIILKVNVARFARTFSSLLVAGVTVIDALDVTSKSLNNVVIQKGLQDAIDGIKNGANIADSLEESKVLPAIIIQMSAVGEETGKLGEVLDKVAEFYEAEVNQVTDSIASIIEPILIVGLGSIVGLIVMSVLGPIISIQGSVQ